MNDKTQLIQKIRTASHVYVLISLCTRQPYVVCDEETFDDEVFLYLDEEAVMQESKRLQEAQIPVRPGKLENKQLLGFFTGMYTMGVNAVVVTDAGVKTTFQLEEIVKKRTSEQMPEGSVWIENPQLHLTALYFMQELRRKPGQQPGEEFREIQEEMTAHFGRGRYIVAVQKEEKNVPLVKLEDGNVYQPVFTDALEFQKFNKDGKFSPAIVEAGKIPQILVGDAKGIVLNPLGVRVSLTIHKS